MTATATATRTLPAHRAQSLEEVAITAFAAADEMVGRLEVGLREAIAFRTEVRSLLAGPAPDQRFTFGGAERVPARVVGGSPR
jgi:hypothetical protein